jgi:chromate transporter
MIKNTQTIEQPGNTGKIPHISHFRIFLTFLVIGATSFGGGVAAYIRRVVVEEKKWIDDSAFFQGLSLAQVLPGPNAANMAIFIGRYLRGPTGAAVAVFAVLLPAIIILTLVAVFYSQYGQVFAYEGILEGVGACAVALIASMAFQMQQKIPLHYLDYLIAAAVFVMIGIARLSILYALIIFIPIAIWIHRPRNNKIHTEEPA